MSGPKLIADPQDRFSRAGSVGGGAMEPKRRAGDHGRAKRQKDQVYRVKTPIYFEHER
jgi:hypothetical protein